VNTEHDESRDPDESVGDAAGALNEDNPEPSEDAGQKGAGDATGASGGLEKGSEPRQQDARQHEKP
jgi:hypothetical protein